MRIKHEHPRIMLKKHKCLVDHVEHIFSLFALMVADIMLGSFMFREPIG